MIGLASLDVGYEGAQGVDGVREKTILLPGYSYVPVAVGIGAEAEAGVSFGAEGGYPGDVGHQVLLTGGA
jgi:hypothetical protein